MKKLAIPALAALAIATLAACDHRAAPGTSSTTVVKEQPGVVKEKETVVKDNTAPSSSTNVTVDATKPAEAPSSTTSSTSVNVDASKPSTTTTESSKSTTSSRVDTPMGSATKTETTTTKTQ